MKTDNTSNLLLRHQRAWLPLLFGMTLLSLSPLHSIFNEWTGVMEFFSGHELVTGLGYHGWASQFYPPLFSLLMGIGGLFTSGFMAGKLISILSASVLLLVAYDLSVEFSGSQRVGLWTQVFLALSPLFVNEALQADNHMLDAMLFNCGLLLFLRAAKEPQAGRLFLLGLICGLAGLTRYTSYVMLLLCIGLISLKHLRRSFGYAALLCVGFAAVSVPWWYYNAKYNGSPLHNLNYLNVCVGVFGWSTNSLHILWRWAADSRINGIGDILRYHFTGYVRNIIGNLPKSGDILLRSTGALSVFAVPGILLSMFRLRPSQLLGVSAVLAASVLVVSQAYTNVYYLLPWTPWMVIIGVAFVFDFLQWLKKTNPERRNWRVVQCTLGALLIVNVVLCAQMMRAYYKEPLDRPLADASGVTTALQQYDPHIASKVIMALDPARAYYVGAKYLATPSDYTGSVEGLVRYEGVSARLRHYAPKYPSNMDESNLQSDYLVYTRTGEDRLGGLHDPPQFEFLMDPKSEKIPRTFKLVYQSVNTVVYAVLPDDTAGLVKRASFE